MILFPIPAESPSSYAATAWDVILHAQQRPASAWWLIPQADHALLAGDLAAHFNPAKTAPLDSDAVRAIALHDAGWTPVDDAVLADHSRPRPLSFLDVPVMSMLAAWTGSIEAALSVGPLGGLMVAGHFLRLARSVAEMRPAADAALVQVFVRREEERRAHLFDRQSQTPQEVETLVDVLQLCDLVSLYLCCGSRQPVEFARAPLPLQLAWDGDTAVLDPSPLSRRIRLTVPAFRFPPQPGESSPTRFTYDLR
ncbi:MAG TPA: DUF3891 family protein [Terriglobales bacterium]|nr:DUF3891 family protein [Terriglobales bacterium]